MASRIVPRGVPHAFLVTSGAARMLGLHTPGGGEQFYRHASEPAVAGENRRWQVDFGRILRRPGDRHHASRRSRTLLTHDPSETL